jgi:hypothetical protein
LLDRFSISTIAIFAGAIASAFGASAAIACDTKAGEAKVKARAKPSSDLLTAFIVFTAQFLRFRFSFQLSFSESIYLFQSTK